MTTTTTGNPTTTTTKAPNATTTSTTGHPTTSSTTGNPTTTTTKAPNVTTTSTTGYPTTTSTTGYPTATSTTVHPTTTSTTGYPTTTSTTGHPTTTSTTGYPTTTSTTGYPTTTTTTTVPDITTTTTEYPNTTTTTSEPPKYAVSLVMDLSKVPNIDQMKEINLSANVIYRNLVESGINTEILSVPINEPNKTQGHTSFISTLQGSDNNMRVDRLLSMVAQQDSERVLNVIAQQNGTDSHSNQRGYHNKVLLKRRKIVYITAGFNGCTSVKTCPGIVSLKKDIDIYFISLSKDANMYREIEYISSEPVLLHSIMMNKSDLSNEASHISKWIRDEYRFNNPMFLIPKKVKKNFKNEVCSKCSKNAECYVHSIFETTHDLSKFECVCSEGYTGDGFTCHDIDECKVGNYCGKSQCCINTLGGFECKDSKDGKC
ncbi:latent transforming growth factor beta binding protein like (3F865) [Cryptosporidium hominis TU502]|nr:latent transforming growth factor beta binding protein like (3F865) [Cryptosporidium hominis TU502]